MKEFIRFCETVSSKGLWTFKKSITITKDSFAKNTLDKNIISKLSNVRPIVFFKEESPEKYIHDIESITTRDKEVFEPKLDAPFPAFSIELFGDGDLGVIFNPQKKYAKIVIKNAVVFETAPKTYQVFLLLYHTELNLWDVREDPRYLNMVLSYINRLNTERVGVENTRQVIKIGSGKNKETHRIRKIVYVCPKKEYEKQNEKLGKQIDWSHRWLVRGHWRKCEGTLGKDREGLHCIPNYTWVVDHVKGPEDKILIADKTRLVKKIGEQRHV